MALNQIAVGVQSLNDSATGVTARGTKDGAQLVQEMHGKYYEASLRGNIFMAYTVIAGVALPVAAATLNSKFTLHNPASSTVNLELISFTMGMDSATDVVNGVGLAIQRALSTGAGVPTSTTALVSSRLGVTGTATGAAYSQATLTNVAIPGVTAATTVPIPFYNMFSMGATSATGVYDITHNFDGRVILEPDSLVAACTTVAPATAAFCQIIWAEYQR